MNILETRTVFSYVDEEEIPDELKCSICYDPHMRPVSTECGHTFCHSCITDWLQREATCPVCRTILMNGLADGSSTMIKQLDALRVMCEDCRRVIKRCDINHHYKHGCPGTIEVYSEQKGEEVFAQIVNVTEKWLSNRRSLIVELRSLQEELDKHHRNVNIAKVSGTSTSLVGTALIIGGFIGSFFTFGASLGLSIAGGAISTAGAITAAGATLTEWGIIKQSMKDIQKKIDHDLELHNELVVLLSELGRLDRNLIHNGNRQVLNKFDSYGITEQDTFSLMTLVRALSSGMKLDNGSDIPIIRHLRSTAAVVSTSTASAQILTKSAGRALMSGMSNVGKAFFVAGFVLSVVTVPLDIYCLVSDSKELHTNAKSATSEKMKTIIQQLELSMLELREEERHQRGEQDNTDGEWQLL